MSSNVRAGSTPASSTILNPYLQQITPSVKTDYSLKTIYMEIFMQAIAALLLIVVVLFVFAMIVLSIKDSKNNNNDDNDFMMQC